MILFGALNSVGGLCVWGGWILAPVHWGILGGKGEGKVPSQGNTFLVIADIIKRSVLTARPREQRQYGYVTFHARC